jgi:hypothetical protein
MTSLHILHANRADPTLVFDPNKQVALAVSEPAALFIS